MVGSEKVAQRRLVWTVLAAMVLVAGSIIRWHRIDTRPPAWDQSVHLHLALDYRDCLLHGKPVTSPWTAVYPPLYHLSLIPVLSLGTPSEAKAAFMHLFYFALLLWGLLRLTRRLGAEPETAVLAGLLSASYAIVIYTMHYALIDFPLTAWVVFSLALLAETESFTHRRNSLMWGVSAGLGVLFKFPFVLFFAGPVAVAIVQSRSRKNAGLAILTAVAVAALWYGWQGPVFLQNALGLAGERGAAEGDPSWTQWQGWAFYLGALYDQLGMGPLLFTGIGLVLFVGKKEARSRAGLIGLTLLSGYLLFTLIHNKDFRYTTPLLPLLALLTILGYYGTVRNRGGRAVITACVLGLWQWNVTHVDLPRAEHWKHRELGEILTHAHDPSQPFLLVSVLSNHPMLFGRNLRWSLRSQGIRMDTSSVGDPNADFAEFVITKSGDGGPESDAIRRTWQSLQDAGRSFTALFRPIAQVDLPDGSQATVYQRDVHPRFKVTPLSVKAVEKKILMLAREAAGKGSKVVILATPEQLREGRMALARLHLQNGTVQGIALPPIDAEITEARLNLYRLYDRHEPGLLSFGSLHVSTQISARQVEEELNSRVKGLSKAQAHFKNGTVGVHARLHGIPLSAWARVAIKNEKLVATITWLRVAGVPIPGFLFGKVHIQSVPLYPIPSFPGRIDIRNLHLDNDLLTLS